MSVHAIVGANWGDEGKGKFTDFLASDADLVVRFQGGSNAGHTIINDLGKFALHLLPSGVFYPNVTNILGPCVAIDVPSLAKELEDLRQRGIAEPALRISDRAQLLFSFHRKFDELEEKRRGKHSFGSTRSGIAPFYSDMHAKIGIQLHELADPKRTRENLELILPQKNALLQHLYHEKELILEELLEEADSAYRFLKPFLSDTQQLLRQSLAKNQNILVEGQLGSLRDPYQGIYPYSTSSSPLASFALNSLGLPARALETVLAVTKAYSSCVGAGPFVSELFGNEAEELRARGGDAGEYGTTTRRPRRVGWFDAVATRYGLAIQGATEVALTNIDVLGYLDEILVCVAYRDKNTGAETTDFPVSTVQENMEPVLKPLPGWKTDISHIRNFSDLPQQARDYIIFLENLLGGPKISWISNGPRREQIIQR